MTGRNYSRNQKPAALALTSPALPGTLLPSEYLQPLEFFHLWLQRKGGGGRGRLTDLFSKVILDHTHVIPTTKSAGGPKGTPKGSIRSLVFLWYFPLPAVTCTTKAFTMIFQRYSITEKMSLHPKHMQFITFWPSLSLEWLTYIIFRLISTTR